MNTSAEEPLENNRTSPRWTPNTKTVIGIILFVLFLVALYAVRLAFVPIILGAILAYLLQPLVRGLRRLIPFIGNELASGIVFLAMVGVLVPIGISLAPLLGEQLNRLQGELIDFLAYVEAIGEESIQVAGFELQVQEIVNEVTAASREFIRTVAEGTPEILRGAVETLLFIIFTLLIGYYLTAESDHFIHWFEDIVPQSYRLDVESLIHEFDLIWAAYLRGQIILAFVVSGIITAVCYAIGMPNPLLMGVLAGILEFLVSIGHTIWIFIAVAVALVEGSTYLPVSNLVFALIVAGAHLVFTKLDFSYLIPAITGQQLRLHPILVLVGILIGLSVGGVLGVALAVPAIATLRVIFRYVYAKLFDLDPFPMVGPLVAPKEDRLAELARRNAEQKTFAPRVLGRRLNAGVIWRIRNRQAEENSAGE